MNTTTLFPLFLACTTSLFADDFEILSLTSKGRLTFTNSFSNALYTVEWASELPTTNWNTTWDSLRSMMPTNPVATSSVPMFYRVTCQTNLLMPLVKGRRTVYEASATSGLLGYAVSTVLGSLKLSSGKEYSITEMVTGCNLTLKAMRSTETEVFTIPSDISRTEGLAWRLGPSGTTWTNQWCDGSSDQITILPNQIISVPAGTFDCLKFESREINNSLRLRSLWWIKPGFSMIQMVDFGNGSTPVMTNRLAAWEDGTLP
jgi:hypothetical protein